MYRIGVIGCGMIAELGHLPAIEQVPGIKLYALFDLDFGRAKQLQRRFNVPHAYPTEEEFYGSNIDAVVICTPAHVHHRNVLDAARAGKHVLCEKPLGVTEEEMLEMDEVMRGAGLQLFTGFNYRFSQSALEIRRLVRENGIGEVRLLRLIYNWHLHGKWHWDEDGRRVDAPLRRGRMLRGRAHGRLRRASDRPGPLVARLRGKLAAGARRLDRRLRGAGPRVPAYGRTTAGPTPWSR
jgi:predicted dehydrogenase